MKKSGVRVAVKSSLAVKSSSVAGKGTSGKGQSTPSTAARRMSGSAALAEENDTQLKRGRGKKGTLNKVRVAEALHRAGAFKATRVQRSMEAAEDYTELVYDLQETLGEARIVSIAAYLGVSHVTALRTVNRLQEEGFLKTSRHQPVELTLKGKKLAKGAKVRHQVVVSFLEKLGVSKGDAASDAEGMEHHVGPATLRAMKRFIGD